MSTTSEKLIQICKRVAISADLKNQSFTEIVTVDDVKVAVFCGLLFVLYDSLVGNEQPSMIPLSKKEKIESLAKVIDEIGRVFNANVSELDAQSVIEGNEYHTLEIFEVFERLFEKKNRYEDQSWNSPICYLLFNILTFQT